MTNPNTLNQVNNVNNISVSNKIDNLITNLDNIECKIIDYNKNNIFENVIGSTMIDLEICSDIEVITKILKNTSLIKKYLKLLNYNIDAEILNKINNLINILLVQNIKVSPIENIINEIKNILSDGKLDIYDVPYIITIITNILNFNLSNVKLNIDVSIITIFIKLLINILVAEKIINLNQSQENINKLIDSSLILLNTSIKLKKIKCNCFPLFCKKK